MSPCPQVSLLSESFPATAHAYQLFHYSHAAVKSWRHSPHDPKFLTVCLLCFVFSLITANTLEEVPVHRYKFMCSLLNPSLIRVFTCDTYKNESTDTSGYFCGDISAAKPNDNISLFSPHIHGCFSVQHLHYKQSKVDLLFLSCANSASRPWAGDLGLGMPT